MNNKPKSGAASATELAGHFGVCRQTILRWARKGFITSMTLPSGIRRYYYPPTKKGK